MLTLSGCGWTCSSTTKSLRIAIKGSANTYSVLLSNDGQTQGGTDNIGAGNYDWVAQTFTTGSFGAGYELDAVALKSADALATLPAITVTLRASPDGAPAGTALATFTNPSEWIAGLNVFTLESSESLEPDTDYFIYVEKASSGIVMVEYTNSFLADSGATAGWSFGNQCSYSNTDRTCRNTSTSQMTLYGTTNPATVPVAIDDLTATDDDAQAGLDWTLPPDGGSAITSFEYRGKIAGSPNYSPWFVIPGSGAGTISHTVTELKNGREYTFQVRAVNAEGNADASNEANATLRGAPTAIDDLSAEAGNAQATLSWTVPFNGGYAITSFEYRRKTTGSYGGWTNIPGSGPTTTTHTVTGLSNGTAYTFQVRAVNAGGSARVSNEPTATPQPPAVPDAITGLVASGGNGQVTLGWTVPDPNRSPITRFQYRRKTTGSYGVWTNIPGSGPTTTSYTVTGLTNGTAYTFQVRAVNAVGSASVSNQPTATPQPSVVLSSNTGQPKFSVDPDDRIWRLKSGLLGGRELEQEFRSGTNPRGYQLAGIEIDGRYAGDFPSGMTVTVEGVESGGDMITLINPATWTTGMNHFAAPLGAVLKPDTDYRLYFSRSSGGNTIEADVNRYNCMDHHSSNQACYIGPDGWDEFDPPTKRLLFDIHGWLPSEHLIRYSIKGTAIGQAELGAPEDLTVSSAGGRNVTLTWVKPSGGPTGYEVQWSITPSNPWHAVDRPHTGTSPQHTVPGGPYYRVRALNAAGAGPWAATVIGRAEATTAPAQAVNPPGATSLRVSAVSDSRIDLRWTTTDPVSTSYDVEWSADGKTGWQAVDPPDGGGDTIHRHTGLTAETTYHYRVRGVNGDGAGAWSDVVSATTSTGGQKDGGGEQTDPTPIPTPEPPAPVPDDYTMDRIWDVGTWGEVSVGGSATGVVEEPGDRDFFSVNLQAGRTYRIAVAGDGDGDGALETTRMHGVFRFLWAEQLECSGAFDDPGVTTYVLTVPSSDLYAASVGAEGDGTGSYQVSVSESDDTATGCDTEPAVVENTPATGLPAISGTAQVDETLTADTSAISDADGLDNAVFSYQWLADGSDISGATGSTYTLIDADEGRAVSVRVSFTDDGGNEETLTSAATDAVEQKLNTPATGTPTVGGTAQVGETLTAATSGIADEDGLDDVAYGFQWLADGADISGATAATYTLVSDDEGKAVSVRVSFTDDAGNGETLTSAATEAVAASEQEETNNPATGAPTISGTAQVGETLTAETSGIEDEDGLDNVAFGYQWRADGADISGATDNTYTLADADEGKTINVTVSFTDDAGNGESLTSDATGAVEARPNSPATGLPAITGTALVGQSLTADTSGISDEDGLDNASFSYQWLSNDGNGDAGIPGATGDTYTLVSGDVGKTIRVRVSFIDDRGHEETLTSAATDAVAGLPPEPMTASIENAATSHDGETAFTFELRFSEEFSLSYKTLRDHAFEVTGGTVNKAKRLEQGSNVGWRITVRPDGNSDVSIVLPITTDCDAQGSICTGDGRKLSSRNELTVSGPE